MRVTVALLLCLVVAAGCVGPRGGGGCGPEFQAAYPVVERVWHSVVRVFVRVAVFWVPFVTRESPYPPEDWTRPGENVQRVCY